ncbi:MAG: SH3 domain-containing protein, partial [Chloroflexota bacterium]|nr:SH3 domain-containing protein [Chloroflexota bacterium]
AVADLLGDGASPGTPAEFTPGTVVTVTVQNGNLRSAPGTGASIVAQMALGTMLTIQGGPTASGGLNWYQVSGSVGTGWAASIIFQRSSNAPSPSPAGKFAIGDRVQVATDALNLRSSASTTSAVIVAMPEGTQGSVIDGPRNDGGYSWYRLETALGTGWAVDSFLVDSGTAPEPGPSPTTGKFQIGDVVSVSTDALNLRSSAGTGGAVVATMPNGTSGAVIGGPQAANGYTWYQLRTGLGTGWAADSFLSPGATNTPPPTSAKFEIGDRVSVSTDALNLRSNAGTSAGIVAVLVTGQSGDVLNGPQSADGYAWYQLRTTMGTGWAADVFLNLAGGTSNGGGIAIGNEVEVVNGTLNLRSGPGTAFSVVTTLADGTILTVLDGPTSNGGYSWYQVSSSQSGTGWCAGTFLAAID